MLVKYASKGQSFVRCEQNPCRSERFEVRLILFVSTTLPRSFRVIFVSNLLGALRTILKTIQTIYRGCDDDSIASSFPTTSSYSPERLLLLPVSSLSFFY